MARLAYVVRRTIGALLVFLFVLLLLQLAFGSINRSPIR
jgi:hypothetical protein